MKIRFAISVGLGPPDPGKLTSICVGAEQRGFDTLWFSDRPTVPLVDPLIGVAYAAAITRRVRLGVNVIPFNSSPYLIAHRLAQLDQLTGGRLLLTLVPGITPQHPGHMMDEVIPKLRSLWVSGLPVSPVQNPLEIWLGGSGPKAVERAGRLADGWLGSLVSAARAGEIRSAIQTAAQVAGRVIDPEHFGLSIAYTHDIEEVEKAVRSGLRSVRPELIPIGREALRRLVADLVDEGLSKFVIHPVSVPNCSDEELDWLADALLDLQT